MLRVFGGYIFPIEVYHHVHRMILVKRGWQDVFFRCRGHRLVIIFTEPTSLKYLRTTLETEGSRHQCQTSSWRESCSPFPHLVNIVNHQTDMVESTGGLLPWLTNMAFLWTIHAPGPERYPFPLWFCHINLDFTKDLSQKNSGSM